MTLPKTIPLQSQPNLVFLIAGSQRLGTKKRQSDAPSSLFEAHTVNPLYWNPSNFPQLADSCKQNIVLLPKLLTKCLHIRDTLFGDLRRKFHDTTLKLLPIS